MYALDTLEHHTKERPGVMFRDLSEVLLKDMGTPVKESVSNAGQSQPEQDAITFYLLNHAVADIMARVELDEPLGEYLPIVNNYHNALSRLGYRLFNYMLVIVTREARHLGSCNWSGGKDALVKKHGEVLSKFLLEEIRHNSQEALFNNTLNVTVGKYLDFLVDLYNTFEWSSAYGGKKWGAVAETLRDCVYGTTTIEMMLDTGYTLAHNGGPIFDKGFHYKHGNKKEMFKILDCQRAGQIPQLVKSEASKYCDKEHSGLLKLIESVDLMKVNPWVNWHLVEKLGAEETYPYEKKSVEAAFQNDPVYIEEMKDINAKLKAKKLADAAAKAKAEENKFEVLPGVFIEKAQAKRAA